MVPVIVGVVMAVVLAIAARLTRFDRDRSFYPTVLIVIATYYVLFACIAGEALVEEIVAASLFSLIALAGALRWPLLVGAGIFLHGVFDAIHGGFISNAGVPDWWPAFCAAVDVVLGVWVLWLASRSELAPA